MICNLPGQGQVKLRKKRALFQITQDIYNKPDDTISLALNVITLQFDKLISWKLPEQ